MTPMKKASSETKSAARQSRLQTRLSALATGFRLAMTPAPETSMRMANSQKRIGDIAKRLFEGIPFLHEPVEDAAQLIQLLLVVDHLGAGDGGDGVVFPQEDGLLG